MKGLRNLDLGNCQSLSNFSPLSKCSQLQELDLSLCPGFEDINLLLPCRSLKKINLYQTGVSMEERNRLRAHSPKLHVYP